MEFKNTAGITIPEIKSILNEITVYDWNHANMAPTTKTSRTIPSNDMNILYTIDENTNTVRVAVPLWLWENADDDSDTVYADVNVEFPLNAYGTYDIKGAVLMTATENFEN